MVDEIRDLSTMEKRYIRSASGEYHMEWISKSTVLEASNNRPFYHFSEHLEKRDSTAREECIHLPFLKNDCNGD